MASTAPAAALPAVQQQPPQSPDLSAIGIPSLDPSQYRSTTSEKLMALASGLLGAPSLGIGLSRGLNGVAGLQSQDRTNTLKAQSDIIAQARAMAQFQNQTAQLGLRQQGLGIQQQRADTARDDGQSRLTQNQQRIDQQGKQIAGKLDGSTARANAAATSGVKEGNEDVDTIQAQGQAAVSKLNAINNFETLSQSPDTNAGPELQQRVKRYFASEFGLGGNVSGQQLADALGKQVASGGFGAAKGMTIRNQKEFDFFKDQMANLDTDPHAATLLLAPAKMAAQHQVDVYNTWNDMPVDQQNTLRNEQGGLDKWRYGQDQAYFQKLGVGGGQSSPTIQKDSSGKWQTTSSGTRFQIIGTTPNQQQ